MKLEKREISLNEKDSLQDVWTMEYTLLREYVATLSCTVRKQTRDRLVKLLQEVCADAIMMQDLLQNRQDEDE